MMNKLGIIAVVLACLLFCMSFGCGGRTEYVPPTTTEPALPQGPPPVPPRIVGSATLEPVGTNIFNPDGSRANIAFSEYFNFDVIAEDRYQQELIVDIIVCSDNLNHYELREPGHILFELTPCPGHGVWEFSPKKLLYENAQTSKDGQLLYTTEVRGKLRSRGDFYKFRIQVTNFDTRRHNVSWEIYVWE